MRSRWNQGEQTCWIFILNLFTFPITNATTSTPLLRFSAHHVTRRCLFKFLKGERAACPVTSHGPCGEDGGGGFGAQLHRDLWI